MLEYQLIIKFHDRTTLTTSSLLQPIQIESSAKNSAKFLTLQLPSSLYKPKGKLNECTFLVFLCCMYSMIRPNLAICRYPIKSNEFGQTGEFIIGG